MTDIAAGRQLPQKLDTVATSETVGQSRATRYLIGAICVALVTIMLWPLVMSFLTSIKPPADAVAVPPTYLPERLSLQNYQTVVEHNAGLFSYARNSLLVAFLTIVFCLGLAIPAGFGLARYDIPFKEPIFVVLLASMMIPYQALLTPLYLLFADLGLVNTHIGLALVHTILQLPFSVFIMRNSFEGVPRELEEAAVIDGASSFALLRRVFLPLVVPGMVTVALFAFIMSWNEFIAALIFMSRESQFTIPIMLTGVSSGYFGSVNWGALQAGVIVSILPCAVVYLLLQRYYVAGFLSGAVK